MTKEAIDFLLALSRHCDTSRFMGMLGTPKRGVGSIDVSGFKEWISESFDSGAAVLSFAVVGHSLGPKSANYPTGLVVGICTMLFVGTHHEDAECSRFLSIVGLCVPNLEELVEEASTGSTYTER